MSVEEKISDLMELLDLNPEIVNVCAPITYGGLSEFIRALEKRAEAAEAKLVPDGWEVCSPGWIERNGPCSCGEAPRIAFGDIGPHYHPKSFTRPAPAVIQLNNDAMCDSQYIAGLQAGFVLGDRGDNDSLMRAVDAYRRQLLDSKKSAPAVSRAELVPDAVGIHDMDPDSKDIEVVTAIAQCEGWNACRAAILRKIEEAE